LSPQNTSALARLWQKLQGRREYYAKEAAARPVAKPSSVRRRGSSDKIENELTLTRVGQRSTRRNHPLRQKKGKKKNTSGPLSKLPFANPELKKPLNEKRTPAAGAATAAGVQHRKGNTSPQLRGKIAKQNSPHDTRGEGNKTPAGNARETLTWSRFQVVPPAAPRWIKHLTSLLTTFSERGKRP